MRIVDHIIIDDVSHLKTRLITWAQNYETVCWLDSNGHKDKYGRFDALLGLGAASSLITGIEDSFDNLEVYQKNTKDWILGYLSYDLKNDLEKLKSENKDCLRFPDLYFFQPQKLFILKGNTLSLHYLPAVSADMEKDKKAILESTQDRVSHSSENKLKIKLRIHKDDYKERVEKMLAHIHRGDIYEANFCQEFYSNGTIDPLATFLHLNSISHAPFATFFKNKQQYLLCTSPERYLCKRGDKVISQPIKGTAKRSHNKAQDDELAKELSLDEKERSENIMITDLVRNDLSRTAIKGSVQVEELCKVHSFKQVHQMISTITSKIPKTTSPINLLKTTFPMGSMTGAPKVSAMQIIENLETTKRGLYSGAVGYFTPEGDFDFNVVIRSILYDAEAKYISFSVGSAITARSIPEKEYEECLLKAKAMREVLE